MISLDTSQPFGQKVLMYTFLRSLQWVNVAFALVAECAVDNLAYDPPCEDCGNLVVVSVTKHVDA